MSLSPVITTGAKATMLGMMVLWLLSSGTVQMLPSLTDLVFRYRDGQCLTAEDERAVVEKLLSYHPHSEDKIGCGLGSIMVSYPSAYCFGGCFNATA